MTVFPQENQICSRAKTVTVIYFLDNNKGEKSCILGHNITLKGSDRSRITRSACQFEKLAFKSKHLKLTSCEYRDLKRSSLSALSCLLLYRIKPVLIKILRVLRSKSLSHFVRHEACTEQDFAGVTLKKPVICCNASKPVLSKILQVLHSKSLSSVVTRQSLY